MILGVGWLFGLVDFSLRVLRREGVGFFVSCVGVFGLVGLGREVERLLKIWFSSVGVV